MTPTATHVCPLRRENGYNVERLPLADYWNGDQQTGLRFCSWCGSLDPDQFVALVEQGCTVTPTDKPYKALIDETVYRVLHNEEPDELTTPPRNHKVYFEHFSDTNRSLFRDLFVSGRVRFGFPGYFTVLPTFLQPPDALSSVNSGFHDTLVTDNKPE